MATQYAYDIDKAFTVGLWPENLTPPNSFFLEECYGWMACEYGLIRPEVVSYPVTDHTETLDTQFMDGTVLNLFDYNGASEAQLKEVSRSDWSSGSDKLSSGEGVSMLDAATGLAVPVSLGKVHYVERSGKVLFTTGTFLASEFAPYDASSPAVGIGVLSEVPVPSTICMYNGRLVMGGFEHTGTRYSDASWLRVFSLLKKYSLADEVTHADESMDASYILVGAPGGGAYDRPFFVEQMLLSGYQDSDLGDFIDAEIRSRRIFLLKMPTGGNIRAMKQLSDELIVYTDKDIYAVRIGEARADFRRLSSTGIYSRDALDGDTTIHMLADTEGRIRTLSADNSSERTHYDLFIAPLLGDDFRVCYDGHNELFYFSDETDAYVRHRSGALSKSRYAPRSLFSYDGASYGSVVIGSAAAYFKVRLSDRWRRGIKLFQHCEFTYKDCTNVTAALEYKYRESDTLKSTADLKLNKESVVYFGRQGTDVRLVMKGTPGTGAAVWRVVLKWQPTDHRYTRGLTSEQQQFSRGSQEDS